MSKFMIVVLTCGLLAAASALPRPKNSRKSYGTMIVGGEPAIQGELPYQLSLTSSNSHNCGGSIIIVGDTQVAITAAHCVDSGGPDRLNVIAGDVKRSDTTGGEQRRQVTRIIVHEDYDGWTNENDIALLTIDQPFELNENVSAIPLPTQGQDTPGEVLVSGWGTLQSGGSLPDVLQKVAIPVVDDATCQQNYPDEVIAGSMICAGLPEGGKDSCQGDSGGPLRAVDGGYLAGLVSWGYGWIPWSEYWSSAPSLTG
ncbi:Trypsin-1 [Orchesella cincta]|uniref:Trypsin-1 n=1 Tax=Orchesella cincta TaxID=48709 RepID=A0A1D2N150_ORCCI|nr:Trypsin-1 [Orchesella cincta]